MSTNGDDTGGYGQMGMQVEKGTVILTLPEKTNYMIMPHDQATEIGTEMVRLAYVAKTGTTPKSRGLIAEQLQEKLHNRCQIILVREIQKKTKLPKIARMLADICIQEVL